MCEQATFDSELIHEWKFFETLEYTVTSQILITLLGFTLDRFESVSVSVYLEQFSVFQRKPYPRWRFGVLLIKGVVNTPSRKKKKKKKKSYKHFRRTICRKNSTCSQFYGLDFRLNGMFREGEGKLIHSHIEVLLYQGPFLLSLL